MIINLPEIEALIKALNKSFVFDVTYNEGVYILFVYKRGEKREMGYSVQETEEEKLVPAFLNFYRRCNV